VLVQELALSQATGFSGEIRLPGSKSIANRALLLASIARGKTRILGLQDAEDVEVLIRNLPRLGIQIEGSIPEITITGAGGAFPISDANLMLENAGTAFRPLVALLSAGRGRFVVDGNEQMRRRPIGDLVRGLTMLGVRAQGEEKKNASGTDLFPPVQIDAQGLPGGETELAGSVSSQFISALLLAAPLAARTVHLKIRE